jgi:hypothetical protein
MIPVTSRLDITVMEAAEEAIIVAVRSVPAACSAA